MPAAQAKLTQRTNVLVQWVWALRERRDEETRGIVHPPPTPEQMVEAGVVVDRFKRWLAGPNDPPPPPANAAPVIDSIAGSPGSGSAHDPVRLTAAAHDPSGSSEPIGYSWTAKLCAPANGVVTCVDDGTLSAPTGATITWTPPKPAVDGQRNFTATATGSGGASTTVSLGAWLTTVSSGPNAGVYTFVGFIAPARILGIRTIG